MPEDLDECVSALMEDGHSKDSAYAICQSQQKADDLGVKDTDALAAVAAKKYSGDWPGIHPAEKTADGREHLLENYAGDVEKLDLTEKSEEHIQFKAQMTGPSAIMKVSDGDEDRFVIWGKASVEVVDKEGDKITADALKNALPQLLRRQRLSLEHSDQLVGDILESFETDEPVTVDIDGKQYTRNEFPTDVLELDKDEEPALYVAGEVWEDTRQAERTREKIEDGEIDSYSISGEAISTTPKVKENEVYDEITDMDLSAVTLCEDGMNQKAKFGTVVKRLGSDDPSKKAASTQKVAVVKDDDTMTDNDTSESDEETLELSRDELQEQFKAAAQDAISDADFVTTEEVKSIVDERLEAADASVTSSEGGEAVHSPDGEDEEDDDEEEVEAADDEEYEEDMGDEEEEEDKALDDEGVQDAVAAIVNAYDNLSREEVENSIEGLVEGSDEDDEVVPEGDSDGEEESKAGYTEEELEEELPDDLYEAVSEYIGGDEEEPDLDDAPEEGDVAEVEAADDEDEEEADDEEEEADDGDMDEAAKGTDEPIAGEDLGKMSDDEYMVSAVAGPTPSPSEEEIEKAATGNGEPDADAETTGTLKALYDDLEEDFE